MNAASRLSKSETTSSHDTELNYKFITTILQGLTAFTFVITAIQHCWIILFTISYINMLL